MPTAVVLEFHGFSSSADEQSTISGLGEEAIAASMGLIAIDGSGGPDGPLRWLVTPGPGGDVEFIDSLIPTLVPCVDQFFVTGFSNGAAFSVVMACRSELNIVAVAPVAYATGPCEGDVDSPIVAFHGTGDGTVPYDGSGFDVLSILLGVGSGPAEEVISDWAAFNGCGDLEEIELAADVDKLEWSACAASTTFYRIANGGHSWPGSGVEVRFGATTDSISASELIVEFFAAQLG